VVGEDGGRARRTCRKRFRKVGVVERDTDDKRTVSIPFMTAWPETCA
jgi:hypothetical protein